MTESIIVKTPLGAVNVCAEDKLITNICFTSKVVGSNTSKNSLLVKAKQALLAYFAGDESALNKLPLAKSGTPFQQKVWQKTRSIKAGKRVSYGEIAKKIGHPKAARAVGLALNKNPFLLAVPCHRVVGASGDLRGFACGMKVKAKLLELEAKSISQ